MSLFEFIISVLLIALLVGVIKGFKWAIKHTEFSRNPKKRRIEEISCKVLIGSFYCMLAFIVFETSIILIAPLIEHLNTAFSIALSKVFAFIDTLIPYAVLGGIGWAWWKKRTPKIKKPRGPLPPPGDETYKAVLTILKTAAKRVAAPLGLAPIQSETDITVTADEKITQHGLVWRLKYRLPKQSGTDFKKQIIMSALQKEIWQVLETEQRLIFASTSFAWDGEAKCIIQVDEVENSDIYVYVYCVIASEEYFLQLKDMKDKSNQNRTADSRDSTF